MNVGIAYYLINYVIHVTSKELRRGVFPIGANSQLIRLSKENYGNVGQYFMANN